MWRRCWKSFSWVRGLTMAGSNVNHQCGANSVGQVDGELRRGTHLRWAGWVGGGLTKGAMAPPSTSLPGKSCPNPGPSHPRPEASQFRSSWCVPGIFSPLPLFRSPEQVRCERASLCPGPLRPAAHLARMRSPLALPA